MQELNPSPTGDNETKSSSVRVVAWALKLGPCKDSVFKTHDTHEFSIH